MLQQILKDMYIDPDVLDALNEEQKKTLFLKMRQEQVRRWKEREEKLETDDKPKPQKAHSKSVNWLLGRDGDVQVIAIGEVDEFKLSKLMWTGLGERKASSLHNNSCNQTATLKSNLVNRTSTEPVRSGRENLPPKTQAGIQLDLKENSEEMRTLPPLQVSVIEQKPSTTIDSVPHQPKESKEDIGSGTAADASDLPPSICYRPHPRPVATAASVLNSPAPTEAEEKSVASLSITTRLRPQETQESQGHRGKDFRVMAASKRGLSLPEEAGPSGGGDSSSGRGRVAQLMKTFSVSSDTPPSQAPPRSNKPPIPAKPSHLRPSASLR